MSVNETKFPHEHPENYGDIRTIAERAGVELKEEDGIPYHCGERMQVKAGIIGPDYVKCHPCGLLLLNTASPHVNGGIIWNEDVMEKFWDAMWTRWTV